MQGGLSPLYRANGGIVRKSATVEYLQNSENIQHESIKTLDLLDKLHLVPEWRDLSPKKLGDILDTFQVKSHHIWKENNARGYFVNQLKQAYFENK